MSALDLCFSFYLTLLMVFWAHSQEDIPSYIRDHGIVQIHSSNDINKHYFGHVQLFFDGALTNSCNVICRYEKIHPHYPVWKEASGSAIILIPNGFNRTEGSMYVQGKNLLLSKLISNF